MEVIISCFMLNIRKISDNKILKRKYFQIELKILPVSMSMISVIKKPKIMKKILQMLQNLLILFYSKGKRINRRNSKISCYPVTKLMHPIWVNYQIKNIRIHFPEQYKLLLKKRIMIKYWIYQNQVKQQYLLIMILIDSNGLGLKI